MEKGCCIVTLENTLNLFALILVLFGAIHLGFIGFRSKKCPLFIGDVRRFLYFIIGAAGLLAMRRCPHASDMLAAIFTSSATTHLFLIEASCIAISFGAIHLGFLAFRSEDDPLFVGYARRFLYFAVGIAGLYFLKTWAAILMFIARIM